MDTKVLYEGNWPEKIIQFDHWLFLKINSEWTASWADTFFPFITDLMKRPAFIYVALPLALIYLGWKHRLRLVRILLGGILAFAVADAITYRVFKPAVERKRPQYILGNQVKLRTHSHSGFSFPSNHATNSFAILVFLGYFIRHSWILWLLAGAVAYSRVYVGVHFPSDVLVGALSGTLIAFLVYTFFPHQSKREKSKRLK